VARALELAAAEARIKDLPDLLTKVEQELSVVMSSIRSLGKGDQGQAPQERAAGDPDVLQLEALLSLLARLEQAVEDYDPAESRALAKELTGIPVSEDLREDLRQIAGLLDQYQFGEAAEILSRARDRLQAKETP